MLAKREAVFQNSPMLVGDVRERHLILRRATFVRRQASKRDLLHDESLARALSLHEPDGAERALADSFDLGVALPIHRECSTPPRRDLGDT